MAIATLEQWKDLYDLADRLKERKPWQQFEDIDLIQIKLPEYREAFTCSFMGKHEFCPGISLYYGIEGYSDVMMLMESGDFPVPSTYVMGDIHALTCYYGDQEELDAAGTTSQEHLRLRRIHVATTPETSGSSFIFPATRTHGISRAVLRAGSPLRSGCCPRSCR